MNKRITKKYNRPLARLFTLIFFSSGYKPKQQVEAYLAFQKKKGYTSLNKEPIIISSKHTHNPIGFIDTPIKLEHLFNYYDKLISNWVDNQEWAQINKFMKRQSISMLATNAVLLGYMPLR